QGLYAFRVALLDKSLRALMLTTIEGAVLLALGAMVFYLCSVSLRYHVFVLILFASLLAVPEVVGGALYVVGMEGDGITWPPRFVTIWAVLISYCLFCVARSQAPILKSERLCTAVLMLGGLLSLTVQIYALQKVRSYELIKVLRGERVAHGPLADLLTGRENTLVTCLGNRLPKDTDVASNGALFARFHNQYVVWPDHLQHSWKFPEVAVCHEKEYMPYDGGCRNLQLQLPDTEFRRAHVDNITVTYKSFLETTVSACKSIAEAR